MPLAIPNFSVAPISPKQIQCSDAECTDAFWRVCSNVRVFNDIYQLKYNVGLKIPLHQGISELAFYGDLV